MWGDSTPLPRVAPERPAGLRSRLQSTEAVDGKTGGIAMAMATRVAAVTWRGDPTSPGFTVYESIGHHGTYFVIVTVGPNVQSYTQSGFAVGVPYSFKVCDRLDPETCSNEVLVRFPR